MSLLDLFKAEIKLIFAGKYNGKRAKFPNKLKGYYLNEVIKGDESSKYSYAIYKNQKNQKAFAKMWSGRVKTINYNYLLNEIILYNLIQKTIITAKKNKIRLPKDVLIPELKAWIIKKDKIVLLSEFIKGKKFETLNDSQKVNAYMNILKFLELIGSLITKQDKKNIGIRKVSSILFLYPFFFLKALISHPEESGKIIGGLPLVLKCIPYLKKDGKLVLAHRDLHSNNIIVVGKKVYILDFQMAAYSFKQEEVVNSLKYFWVFRKFHRKLIDVINKYFETNIQFSPLFKGLAALSFTFAMTDNFISAIEVSNWDSFMKFFM